MPLPGPSSPPPTLWRHREAIIPESTEYSFTTELQNRLGLQASQAAPVPELRRSLQRQATSTEAIHKNGTDVQEKLPPSMVDTARQVSESLAWDIKFRTRAPVSHHTRDTRSPSCHAEPQSRSLKNREYSGEFNSKVDLLLDCDAKEISTPDVQEVRKMADLQSSEISIQYSVSLRGISEKTFPGHADAPFRHWTTPDNPEVELFRTVQKSSKSFWGLPMGVAKHAVQVHQLRDATSSHRAKGYPRTSEDATPRISKKWSTAKTHDQDLTYTAGTEQFKKAAQGQEIGQKLEKPNDIGTYSSSNTMKTAVTVGTRGASNKKGWQKTKQKRSGTLALSKGSLAAFFLNTMQKSMNYSIKQSALKTMGAPGTRRRKGRFVMSSRDDTATESSETKPPKNRKQSINQKLEASTCRKVTGDTEAISCGPKQTRLDRSSNFQLMDESAVSAVSHTIRIKRRRDSDVRDVDVGPQIVHTENVSGPTFEPGDSKSLAGTMIPRSLAFRSTQFIPDTIPQSRWQTMKLQQNVDIEEKPFAQVLADIEDGDSPKVETTTTGTMITTEAVDESKLDTALINTSRDSKTIKNAPRRRSLGANEGTSKFSVVETTSFENEVPLSTAVLPIPITSDEAYKKTSHNLNPFCRSEEGPLIMSESTSLSFVSSGSSVSECHRSTDLAGISRLMTLEAPTKKTGDGKFPVSDAHQVTSDVETCDFKGRLSRSVQVGFGGNRTSRVSTNETESSAATEHLWNKSMLRVVLMGNHHYIRERTASLQRDMLALPSTLDETQYIWNQIINSPNSAAQTPVTPFGLPSDLTVPKNPKVKGSGHIVNKQTTRCSERFSCSEEACRESQVFAPQKFKNLALMKHPLVSLMKPLLPKPLERSSAHFPKQMSSSTARDPYVFQGLLAPDISDGAPQLHLDCRTVTQELSTGTVSKDARGNVFVTLSPPEALGISGKLEQGSCTTTLQQACVKGRSQAPQLPLHLPMCEHSLTSVQEQLLLSDVPCSPTAIQPHCSEVLSFSSNMDTAVRTTVTSSRETLESSQVSKSLSLSSRRNRELSTRILQGTGFESMYNSILQVQSTVARDNIVPTATVRNFATTLSFSPSFGKQYPTFQAFTSGASDTITEQPSDIPSLLVKPRAIRSEKKTLLKHLGPLCPQQPKQWRHSRHKMASLLKPRNLKSLRPSVHRYATCRNSSPVVLWHQPVVSLKPKLGQQRESKPQQRAETSPMEKFQGLRGKQEQTHVEWPRPMALRRPESADPIANREKQSPYLFGDYDTEWESSLLPDSTKLDWSDDEGATPQ